jgi:hypothetical protein
MTPDKERKAAMTEWKPVETVRWGRPWWVIRSADGLYFKNYRGTPVKFPSQESAQKRADELSAGAHDAR